MDDSWAAVIDKHWPWLIVVAAIVFGIPYTIKALQALKAFLYDPFLGWFKRASLREQRKITEEREKVVEDIADLQRQVLYLSQVVEELRWRDQMTWAWILSDQEWHRRAELEAIEKGYTLPDHVTYEDFRDEWTKTHPMPSPYRVSVS